MLVEKYRTTKITGKFSEHSILETVGEFSHSKNLLGIYMHVLNNAVDSRKKLLMLLEKY